MAWSILTVALAASGCLGVASATPEQIHITLAGADVNGDSNGMTLSWATATSTATSTVYYGTDPSDLSITATGYGITYLAPYEHHHAIITGLKPSTTYYYKVGDATDGFSPVLSFVSAPTSTTTAFAVAVFGDLGYGVEGNAVETRAQLDRAFSAYDLILHVGDIAYADDYFLHNPLTFGYETVYNNYLNNLQNVTSAKPYMVLPGNHEGECHSPVCLLESKYRDTLNNFTAFNARFRMPADESGASGANMWWSANYGNMHFVQIDTETDYPNAPMEHACPILPCGGYGPNGAQLAWLEADLAKAAANRKQRPWVVVSGHRPIYRTDFMSADGAPTGEAYNLQVAIEGLLMKYGVDIYFAGHKHSYQRTLPVFNNTVQSSYVNPSYPVHLIVGGAGCDEMKASVSTPLASGANPAWLAYADGTFYGMGILNVVNNTVLQWQWFQSNNGSVLDAITIVKNNM